MNAKTILAAAMLTMSAPAMAANWPAGMRDALAYCRSPDVDPLYAMDRRRLLTDKQCALRFLKATGPSTIQPKKEAADTCYEAGETEHVTLAGEIVQSATIQANDGTGEPAGVKYFAIALDRPICFQDKPTTAVTVVRADPISNEWLGRHAVIVGNLTLDEDLGITVQSIKETSFP